MLRWREVPGAGAGAGGDAASLAAARYAYDVEFTEFVLDSGEKMA